MTDLAPQADATPPPGPSPVALAVAFDLVTRYRMRLADGRDSRLGTLGAGYELATVIWNGPRAALVAFYEPPADAAAAGRDLAMRCDAARRWGRERLQLQAASVCDILLVALRPVSGSITTATPPGDPVRVGAAWVDAEQGSAGVLLPIPPGLPQAGELRARARHVRDGDPVPTLAAVDLAERQTVAGGYAAPVRRQVMTQPVVTYGLIGAFVVIYILEQTLLRRFPSADSELFVFGALGNASGGEDWWRFISSAFLHDNTSFFHILFNGLAMLWIGRLVEQLYGRLVLVGTFLITAVAGGLFWIGATAVGVEQAGGITIGASGGISGLVGLLLVLGRVQGRNVPAGVATGVRNYAIIVIALNIVLGFLTSGVNNFAHLGGVIVGVLVGLVIPPMQRIGGRDLSIAEKAALIGVIAIAAVALALAVQSVVSFLTAPSGFQFQ